MAAERTFEQDPRFGLCVLSEIASRALSRAVNDPGTAIDVIGRAVRLLAKWSRFEASETDPAVAYPHVWVPAITAGDMFDDVFAPIARDGSGSPVIQIRLQKAFLALLATDCAMFGDAARRHSARALKWAQAGLTLQDDQRAVELAAAQISSISAQNPGSA